MSNMNKIMMKGMNKIMLSCDKATYLITRNEFEKLNYTKRMQLSMHLAGCKYCRRFAEQSKYITEQLNKLKDPKSQDFSIYLTEKQKNNLNIAIENQIDNR